MSRDFEPLDYSSDKPEDLYEPDDGRDSQAYDGSSDAPESMHGIDPLAPRKYLLDDDLESDTDLDNELGQLADEQEEDSEEDIPLTDLA